MADEKQDTKPDLYMLMLHRLSGYFLTECIPFCWEDMNNGEQYDFISEHKWKPFDNTSTDTLLETILEITETALETAIYKLGA